MLQCRSGGDVMSTSQQLERQEDYFQGTITDVKYLPYAISDDEIKRRLSEEEDL
jgi:hypothetical protein